MKKLLALLVLSLGLTICASAQIIGPIPTIKVTDQITGEAVNIGEPLKVGRGYIAEYGIKQVTMEDGKLVFVPPIAIEWTVIRTCGCPIISTGTMVEFPFYVYPMDSDEPYTVEIKTLSFTRIFDVVK